MLAACVWEDVFRCELPGKSFKPCCITVFTVQVVLGPEVQIRRWGGGGGGVLQGLCLGDLGSGWHRAPVMLLQSCTLRRVTGLLQPYSLTVLYVLS